MLPRRTWGSGSGGSYVRRAATSGAVATITWRATTVTLVACE